MPTDGRTTEQEIAEVILRIAAGQPNGLASFDRIREDLPAMIPLTIADLEMSATRPGERMWEQRMRNIQSHYASSQNYIHLGYLDSVPNEGYRITQAGRARLGIQA